MLQRREVFALTFALFGATAFGCAGRGGGSNGGTSGTGDSAGSGSTGGSASGGAGGTSVTVPTSAYLQTDIRRLTNAEYDSSVHALLGTSLTPAASTFAPDSTQSGYSVNEAQVVASVMAKALDTAAQALVTEARGNGKLAGLAPCSNPTAQGATCAGSFIASFGAQAYRRPVADGEAANLMTVYQAAVTGDPGSSPYDDGIDLITRTILQSPGFLYITELRPGCALGRSDGHADAL
jgi:hypothetical protein